MPAIIITMLIIVALAALVTAVVAVGMRGKWSDRNPDVADRLGVLGKHLNGEAEAPEQFVQMYDKGTERMRQVAARRHPATSDQR
ncbi:hypothetical protein ACQB6R_08635 [Propionibacteriaceae bacterium G1746]|uniref:hypothetical protein n=1 Tax=Aestuariimicrobium sp. G57 TaxID=3418485 RepID=UPI003C1D2EE9